jgi:hypothetical protein
VKKLVITFCLAAVSAFAGSWDGTVVDVMCKGKDLASHPKQCALSCSKSGFGLVTSDGKFYKFDESGNAKALAAVKKTTKDKDLKATVTGAMDGDVIKVDSIKISD